MIELQTVTTKAKNPSTNEFQDVTWGGINVLSTSGTTNYNNLTNKPTINGVIVQGSLTTGDLLITAADVGALPSGTKYGADFALSIDSQTFVVTAQLKDQDGNNLGQAKTIDLPLETMVVSGSYDDTTQKIILTLKNGQTVEFSVADLVSGLQSEITLNNKLDADLVSDVSSGNKFVTTAEKTAWNGKQDAISDLSTIRSGAAAGATAVQPTDMNTALAAKQDTLTFDTVPTENSTNPVTSGGVAASQAAQDAEIAVIANAGAKNLLRNEKNAGATVERQGATWVFDQTSVEAKVSGSVSTTWSDVYLLDSNLDLSDKEYTIVIESDSPDLFAYIPGNTLSGGNIPTNGQYYAGVYKYKGIMTTSTRFTAKTASYSNNTIRCMICPASITDSTFVPYAKTNVELTGENASQQSEIDYAVNTGAKNLFPYGDLTEITTNFTDKPFSLQAGNYKLSFQVSATTGSFAIRVKDASNNSIFYATADNSATTKTYDLTLSVNAATITFYSSVSNNFTNIMIRSAAITDPTYEPYALPNPTLTPAVIKAVDEGAKNIADFTSTTKTTYTTATFHGVTITRNGDIFTVSGTSDTNNNAFFNIYYEGSTTTKIIPPGNWVALIDDYTGSVVKDIAVQIAAPDVPPSKPYGTPVRFSLSGSETGNWLRVNIRPSTTYNGSFRLMICSQKDYAISTAFVPYAPTNRELYERNNVIDISSAVTAVTGYTVKSTTHLYYQNKKVFGTIVIAINSGSYSSSLTAIAKLPVEYAPARQHLGSCWFSTDQWAITDIGYAFIQSANASSTEQRGQISVKSPTANLTHMILNVCYPVQIDEVLAAT